MQKSRAKLILLTVAFFLSFFCIKFVSAQDYGGLETTAGAANLKGITSVQSFIGNIIGAGLSLISVIFFALMLFAGIRWMTARGNEEAETKARDTIFAAAIGMVIIMASYGLTNLVFNAATRGGTMAGSSDSDKKISSKSGNEIPKAGSWCLILEDGQCLQGGGSPCSGKLFNTQDECISDDAANIVCLIDGANGQTCEPDLTALSCKTDGGAVFADMAKCTKVADSSVELSPEGYCIMNTAVGTICPKLDINACNAMANNGYGCRVSGNKCVTNPNTCAVDFKFEYTKCISNPGCEWVGEFKTTQKNACVVNMVVEFGCDKLSKANCNGFCEYVDITKKCVVANSNVCTSLADNNCLDNVPQCMIP